MCITMETAVKEQNKRNKTKSELSLWWLNLALHKLDLTKIIFFTSDWTEHQ